MIMDRIRRKVCSKAVIYSTFNCRLWAIFNLSIISFSSISKALINPSASFFFRCSNSILNSYSIRVTRSLSSFSFLLWILWISCLQLVMKKNRYEHETSRKWSSTEETMPKVSMLMEDSENVFIRNCTSFLRPRLSVVFLIHLVVSPSALFRQIFCCRA